MSNQVICSIAEESFNFYKNHLDKIDKIYFNSEDPNKSFTKNSDEIDLALFNLNEQIDRNSTYSSEVLNHCNDINDKILISMKINCTNITNNYSGYYSICPNPFNYIRRLFDIYTSFAKTFLNHARTIVENRSKILTINFMNDDKILDNNIKSTIADITLKTKEIEVSFIKSYSAVDKKCQKNKNCFAGFNKLTDEIKKQIEMSIFSASLEITNFIYKIATMFNIYMLSVKKHVINIDKDNYFSHPSLRENHISRALTTLVILFNTFEQYIISNKDYLDMILKMEKNDQITLFKQFQTINHTSTTKLSLNTKISNEQKFVTSPNTFNLDKIHIVCIILISFLSSIICCGLGIYFRKKICDICPKLKKEQTLSNVLEPLMNKQGML